MHKMNSLTPVIKLSPNLKDIQADTLIHLKAGSSSCTARISNGTENSGLPDNFLLLNQCAARKLKLPADRYLIYASDINELLIGPVVGVLTSAIHNKNMPHGKTARLFKEMIEYSRRRGIFVYLFGSNGISQDRRYIRGISTHHNSWKPGIFPWPDIIYNRIRFRKLEKRQEVARLLREINKDQRVYIFNSRFLNKQEVYNALNTHPEARNMLPDTKAYNRHNLELMLRKYSELFIKPNHGSIGRGIYKIMRQSPQRYCFAGVSSGAPHWKGPYTFELLYRHLSGAVLKENYLIQQAVDLAIYKSRLFDVRSQVQKNSCGEWILTGAAVRVAGKGRFVTHIPNGGRPEVFDEVIKQVFPSGRSRQLIYEQLRLTCTLLPEILEKRLGINLAILTMDLGIDKSGKMWVLEVNSKPSSFDEDDIRMEHLQNLSDYFVYAARRKNRKVNYEA